MHLKLRRKRLGSRSCRGVEPSENADNYQKSRGIRGYGKSADRRVDMVPDVHLHSTD